MKKFLISVGAVVAALAIAVVVVVAVLANKYTKIEMEFSTPRTISVYNKTDKATDLTEKDENFKKIVDALNNSMKITKLNELTYGKHIQTKPQICSEPEPWSTSIKRNKICIQLSYAEEKTITVYEKNDSKQIKFKYLMIVLNDKNGIAEQTVYYSDSSIFDNKAFVLQFNAKNLKKYAK